MLIAVDPEVKGVVSPVPIGAASNCRARDGAKRRSGVTGEQTHQNGKTGEDPDWAAHILRIRDHGDRKAFALLFRHFAPRIKGYLMKSGADATQAEDCAQDVMTTLWRKAHLYDPARASAATWIFTIARNRRIDALRRQKRPEPEDLPWGPEPEPEAADALALSQETEHLATALSSQQNTIAALQGQVGALIARTAGHGATQKG